VEEEDGQLHALCVAFVCYTLYGKCLGPIASLDTVDKRTFAGNRTPISRLLNTSYIHFID